MCFYVQPGRRVVIFFLFFFFFSGWSANKEGDMQVLGWTIVLLCQWILRQVSLFVCLFLIITRKKKCICNHRDVRVLRLEEHTHICLSDGPFPRYPSGERVSLLLRITYYNLEILWFPGLFQQNLRSLHHIFCRLELNLKLFRLYRQTASGLNSWLNCALPSPSRVRVFASKCAYFCCLNVSP